MPPKPTEPPKVIRAYRLERRPENALAAVEVTVTGSAVTERDLWQPDVPSITATKLEAFLLRAVGL